MFKNKKHFIKLINSFEKLVDIKWTSQNHIKIDKAYFTFRDTLIKFNKSKIYEDVWHQTDITLERINLFP